MRANFWHKVWENNSIGFHQHDVHPFLKDSFQHLLQAQDKRVFVPLCGKSLDMAFLAEYMDVIGSELSDIACNDFFADKQLTPKVSSIGEHKLYQYENISLYQGDFFSLQPMELGKFDWVYDRAALIAMSPHMQQVYIEKLMSFVGENTKLLLVALEFPKYELSGPPFPIFDVDIKRLFNTANLKIEKIANHSLQDKRFAQREFNVSSLVESYYLIQR